MKRILMGLGLLTFGGLAFGQANPFIVRDEGNEPATLDLAGKVYYDDDGEMFILLNEANNYVLKVVNANATDPTVIYAIAGTKANADPEPGPTLGAAVWASSLTENGVVAYSDALYAVMGNTVDGVGGLFHADGSGAFAIFATNDSGPGVQIAGATYGLQSAGGTSWGVDASSASGTALRASHAYVGGGSSGPTTSGYLAVENRLSVGAGNSPSAHIHVAGSAGLVKLRLNAAASQSVNLVEIYDATPTLRTFVDPDGDLTAKTVTASSLTNGRVVLAGTAGLLQDDAGLTYNTGTDTLTAGAISASTVTATGMTAGRMVYTGTSGLLSSESVLTYDASGNKLAINDSATPSGMLHVRGNGTDPNIFLITEGGGAMFNARRYDDSASASFTFDKADGTLASPGAVDAGENIMAMTAKGWDGSAFDSVVIIRANAEAISGGNISGYFALEISDASGVVAERFRQEDHRTLITSNAAGATLYEMKFQGDTASPAALDSWILSFHADDSAGNDERYGFISPLIIDPTNGSESGAISFNVADGAGGEATPFLIADSGVSASQITLSGMGTGKVAVTDGSSVLVDGPDWDDSGAGRLIVPEMEVTEGIYIDDGANESMGRATLVAGTVTVNNTRVTANSNIMLTTQIQGGTPGDPQISARVASTSFTITSTNAGDTSTVAWVIMEPN